MTLPGIAARPLTFGAKRMSSSSLSVSFRHPDGRGFLANASIFGDKLAPMSDYFALFCNGGIRIRAGVKKCAWICGENGFGDHVVTAEERADMAKFE